MTFKTKFILLTTGDDNKVTQKVLLSNVTETQLVFHVGEMIDIEGERYIIATPSSTSSTLHYIRNDEREVESIYYIVAV